MRGPPEMRNPAAANGRANRNVEAFTGAQPTRYSSGESLSSVGRIAINDRVRS
jgi:hypothetical protein